MGVAIPIETSARHIHMCRNDFEALFGEGSELTYKADLSQPGQFVAKELSLIHIYTGQGN